ncbi:MAG: LysR substrate-binding domain-containing protein [Orrella sp.]
MLTIKRLRCFVAVAEEGHFNQAATRLGMSQPPLTEHIRVLEATLGCRLFERTTRAVKLTLEGQALLEHARFLLAEVERTQEIINASRISRQEHSVVLRLGLLHAHSYTFLPPLLSAFVSEYPACDVRLVEYSTEGQLDTILSSQVAVGLIREPLNHPEIDVQTLFTEPYVLAVPTAMRSRAEVDISILQGHPIIDYPSHDDRRSTRSLFRDFLSQHKVQPSAWREVTTMHSALAMVAASLGIAPVPESQSSLRLKGVVYRPLKQEAPKLSVGLAKLRDNSDPLVQRFIRFARDHFAT